MSSSAAATSPLAALTGVGTSVWLDQIRRSLLETGEFERLVREDSVTGVTANPSIFEKAILGSPDYDERLAELTREGHDAETIYETLAVEDVRAAADVLRPVYDASDGRDGYASLEVAPSLAHDADGTLASVRDFWGRLDRPNVMIKIPGTPEGTDAIRRALAAGINVNVTLLFAVEAYAAVTDAWLSALEERVARGEPIDRVASVASFFVSRVDTAADRLLSERGRADLAGRAAVANARRAYAHFQSVVSGERFAALREHGARPQRPLWASTGMKDPTRSAVLYVEELAGPESVNTMPMATLLAFAEHGTAEDRLTAPPEDPEATLAEVEAAGVSMRGVTDALLEEGIEAFAASMGKLLAGIETRRSAVVAGPPAGVEARLTAPDAEAVGGRVRWAEAGDVARRVWRRDHTLWGPEPAEIADRLGWLTIAEQGSEHLGDLVRFTDEVRAAGFTDALLLGMGGSSLAPLVVARTFGAREGYLRLHVLDSTHPDAVRAAVEALPAETTLVVVSTKSGGTLETRSLYEELRARIPKAEQFVAITDPGSALADLSAREGFRRTFLGAPDIGGRYSALSAFGLVPAALAGVDLEALLDRAEVAAAAAQPSVPCRESPALWLGLAVGELARRGRDKLTFVVDPPLRGFALWAEQLVAESTGKEGRGIVPVADEPLGDAAAYGSDRVFAHLRNSEAPDAVTDERLATLAQDGHPVITVPVADAADLGAQFFGWEFAVAVAGAVLGVNAFDQPNVQEAKDLTAETLEAVAREGSLPEEPAGASRGALTVHGSEAADVEQALADLMSAAEAGTYVAIQCFLPPSDAADAELTRLRELLRNGWRATTTAGYGPRYLHSTGQLHKGGPPAGVFLQLTSDGTAGVGVPGAGYDFATLIGAQAVGDARALRSRGRPFLHVHLSGDPVAALGELTAAAAGAVDRTAG